MIREWEGALEIIDIIIKIKTLLERIEGDILKQERKSNETSKINPNQEKQHPSSRNFRSKNHKRVEGE